MLTGKQRGIFPGGVPRANAAPLITRSPRGRLKTLNSTSALTGVRLRAVLGAICGTNDIFGPTQSDFRLTVATNPKQLRFQTTVVYSSKNHAPVAPMTLAGLESSAEDCIVDPNKTVAVSSLGDTWWENESFLEVLNICVLIGRGTLSRQNISVNLQELKRLQSEFSVGARPREVSPCFPAATTRRRAMNRPYVTPNILL